MKRLDVIAAVLLVVGGLNWGIIALGGPDLVASLLGAGSMASRLVYGLVGLSAVWQALQWRGIQRRWMEPVGTMAALALVTLFAAGTLQAQAAPAKMSETKPAAAKNIVETAVAAGQFKTLAAALDAAGLIPTLSGPGPFTVFAPTDAAFAQLPEGTVPALLKDKAKLTAVLTYHVVSGVITAKDLKAKADKDGYVTLKTVQGADLKLHLAGTKVHVGDKSANVTSADVAASNGVIHVIDAVLLPPS